MAGTTKKHTKKTTKKTANRTGQGPSSPEKKAAKKGRTHAAPKSKAAEAGAGRRTDPTPSLRPPVRRYLKSKPVCKVTFRLPAEAVNGAEQVAIVGDFNSWDGSLSLMKRLKDGSCTLALDLEPGREYRFRYLIDDAQWENDWCADRYEPNSFGSDDSVIVI